MPKKTTQDDILSDFFYKYRSLIALSLIMPMYQLIGHVNDAGAGAAPPK